MPIGGRCSFGFGLALGQKATGWESLDRAPSADGNPSVATRLKAAKALGAGLHAEAVQQAVSKGRLAWHRGAHTTNEPRKPLAA